jgi:hypothetical protein
MQAYEGYLENDRFYPIGPPVRLLGRRRVVLAVFEESVSERDVQTAKADGFWAEIDRMAKESSGEDMLLLDEAFSRRPSGREYKPLFDEG